MTIHRAFILIELLLATVLIGIGLAGILSAFSSSVRAHTAQERRTAALLLASRELGEIQKGPLSASEREETKESKSPDGYRITTEFSVIADSTAVRVRVTVKRGDDSIVLVRYLQPVGSGQP